MKPYVPNAVFYKPEATEDEQGGQDDPL